LGNEILNKLAAGNGFNPLPAVNKERI
jgi:hypothetical protein